MIGRGHPRSMKIQTPGHCEERSDEAISQAVFNPCQTQAGDCFSRAIEHLKKRFVEEGLEAALERKPREKPSREYI